MLFHHLATPRTAAIALSVMLVTAPVGAQKPDAPKRYTIPELVRAMSPAVVFIGNTGRKGQVESIGSGFVVDAGGLIVTNYHVIAGAQALQVKTLDGEIYDRVEVVDHDERRDLAVLKVRPFKPMPTVQLATTEPEVGEEAVAIGNPKGLEHTVTAGMVSAFRQAEGYRLMQISVPISPGSSGGPVFNMAGRVIGVATAQIRDAQNLNFAVPVDYARPLIESKNTPLVGPSAVRCYPCRMAQADRRGRPATYDGLRGTRCRAWPAVRADRHGPGRGVGPARARDTRLTEAIR